MNKRILSREMTPMHLVLAMEKKEGKQRKQVRTVTGAEKLQESPATVGRKSTAPPVTLSLS